VSARKGPRRKTRARRPRPARVERSPESRPERHLASPTAIAADALRTGVVASRSPLRLRVEIPREDEPLRAGDPDDSGLFNEYVGEDLPGASNPTPDQNQVDAIGRAYGVQEEDAGELRTSSELMARRDRRRSELKPPRRPQP
jgi:hypothetical protein